MNLDLQLVYQSFIAPGNPFYLKTFSICILSSSDGHLITFGNKLLKKRDTLFTILNRELLLISIMSATSLKKVASLVENHKNTVMYFTAIILSES